MVSIKEAADNALTFARASLGPERTASARLEEVESATIAGEDVWLITLSMAGPDVLSALFDKKREYKTFTVCKSGGEVTSMKIRELADA